MREILPQTMFLYEYDTIQFSYNVTLYLTVLCRAAPALNQNLSGAPSPYLAFRAPLRFKPIYGVESVPRFQPIFSIQSAPPHFQAIFCVESGPKFSVSFIFI